MSYTFPNTITINSNELELNETESSFSIPSTTTLHVQIHEKAVKISTRYKNDEVELIDILEQVEDHKVYLHYKCSSLHQYGVQKLKLSENVVYSLIGIMRKSREVPELKLELQQGNLNLSNARRIVPLLTQENKNEWIKKASTLTQVKLEKEIVKVKPRMATPERAKYINHNRIKLELGLYEKDMMKLRRVQDLVCQSKGESSSLEDTLIAMMDFYLQHKDAVVKAKRVYVKKGFSSDARAQGSKKGNLSATKLEVQSKKLVVPGQEIGLMPNTKKPEPLSQNQIEELATPTKELVLKPVAAVSTPNQLVLIPKIEKPTPSVNLYTILNQSLSKNPNKNASPIKPPTHWYTNQTLIHKRALISAHILHQVNLRDQRKCTYPDAEGKPCNQTRWTQIHHKIPVSKGGKNTLENLITLCSSHHRWVHLRG